MRFADRPAGNAFDVTLHPPAIENAQAGDAVEGGFHSAGAGSFQRILRGVEPEIAAGSEIAAEFEVVIVEKNDGDGFLEGLLGFENALDDIFSAAHPSDALYRRK